MNSGWFGIPGWFGAARSFATKVTLLVTATSAIALIGVCFTLATMDYLNLRQETIEGLRAQAMLVAMNSSAPMAFHDPDSAEEALSAFRTRPAIVRAILFDAAGTRFAAYARGGMSAKAGADAADQRPTQILTIPLEEKGRVLGHLTVDYDLYLVRAHFWRALTLSMIVSVVAILLVYLTSLRIRRVLIQPIALLSRTAHHVSKSGDYSQRAPKVSDDELGTFTETFNEMLGQIQKQDLEIQSSRADALRANRLKDEFLATLSHELRTPMAPIVGWAQILRLSAHDANKVLQAADVIERNARSQNKIIDDLLDMSRIVSGKLKLELAPLDLRTVIEEACSVVAPTAADKDVALRKNLARGVTGVRGDAHRLQQVIWNLLSNAIKFTPAGGSVEVTLDCDDAQARITVRDSGQGIAPEFLPHVFDRFRQADSTQTRKHSGLGLGLAIAKQLVEMHGGRISAASAGDRQGATFTVLLPVLAEDPVAAAPRGPGDSLRPAVSLRGVTVLVVEDEQDTRELIEQVLRLAGANVLACASAMSALGVLEHCQPDVLVSDIAMPDFTGYELIRHIRASTTASQRQLPAIALTAFARPEDRNAAIEAGFQQHLVKPIDNQMLVMAVGSLARETVT